MSQSGRWARCTAIALSLAVAVVGCGKATAPKPAKNTADKPTLLLLTSLPITFGEGFSIADAGSPLLTAIEKKYTVVPIDVSDPASLARGGVMLAAQPRAQTAQNLVALDHWVRAGGRMVLLADPLLERHSDLPLGDPARAMPMFADTGLLDHWGLRLDAPDKRGPVSHDGVSYNSPGHLVATGGDCIVAWNEISADCRLGKGRAIVVADADFLDGAMPGEPSAAGVAYLTGELARAAAD